MAEAARFRIEEITISDRPVGLRLPFNYGIVTLRRAREAMVRVRIRLESGRAGMGVGAELMAPKWFAKDPSRSNADDEAALRRSLDLACSAYLTPLGWTSAFDLHADHAAALAEAARGAGLTALEGGFGQALLDKAVLAALCDATGLPFSRLIGANIPGIDTRTTPDLIGIDLAVLLGRLRARRTLRIRHTIGLDDPLRAEEITEDPGDGRPVSLDQVIAATGATAFKIKLSGGLERDRERLARISHALSGIPKPLLTLDGNECFSDPQALPAYWAGLLQDRDATRLLDHVLFLEQPVARGVALHSPVPADWGGPPLLIDESDESTDAFMMARNLGYSGVSAKSCKGVYRGLLNAVRVRVWNLERRSSRMFISAEDLCTQPGPALQQDLALASLIGSTHVERNGHHYGDGITGIDENLRHELAGRFPGLYRLERNAVVARIENGVVAVSDARHTSFYSGKPH